nr:helix-turn-helix transcriptional regulator [uncultured Cohaesibacter sp.]
MANHPLKDWRLQRRLTQTELGDAIGVTKAAVSRYEQGIAPSWAVQVEIFEFTEGAVTPNDWLPNREIAS